MKNVEYRYITYEKEVDSVISTIPFNIHQYKNGIKEYTDRFGYTFHSKRLAGRKIHIAVRYLLMLSILEAIYQEGSSDIAEQELIKLLGKWSGNGNQCAWLPIDVIMTNARSIRGVYVPEYVLQNWEKIKLWGTDEDVKTDIRVIEKCYKEIYHWYVRHFRKAEEIRVKVYDFYKEPLRIQDKAPEYKEITPAECKKLLRKNQSK